MGWSTDIVRPEVDRLFKKLKLHYEMARVVEPYPTVRIRHQGELTVENMSYLVNLFPADVYIEFDPNVNFGPLSLGEGKKNPGKVAK